MHRWLTVRFMTAVDQNCRLVSRKAKELLDNGKITATINELSNMHQQRHQITIESLSNQLDEDRDFARQKGIPRLPFQQQWAKHDCLVC